MSLVAYDTSDESEEDISKQENLPVSKSTEIMGVKKQRDSVKITIPSLKEFEKEENDEVPRKIPKFQSGSGLFSLLPPPKNSTALSNPGFVPHILKSRKEHSSSSYAKQCGISSRKLERCLNPTTSVSPDNDSCDDVSHGIPKSSEDFFALEDCHNNCTPSNYASIDINLESSHKDKLFSENLSYDLQSKSASFEKDSDVQKQPCELSTSSVGQQLSILNKLGSMQEHVHTPNEQIPLADTSQINTNFQPGHSAEYYPTSVCEHDAKDSLLEDKEFLKLQGRRREFENIDFIDVNAADQLTDKNEWLMKSLTEESTYRPSRKKHNMPTQQQKRKHQITYLAFQAKEREMDLKNQWALNSRTKRETQAKYGF